MQFDDLREGTVLTIRDKGLYGWFSRKDTPSHNPSPILRFRVGSCLAGSTEGTGRLYGQGSTIFYIGDEMVACGPHARRRFRFIYVEGQLGYIEFHDVERLRPLNDVEAKTEGQTC
jgi:hypothetical protein